jgi:hypothetical protein
LNLRSELNLHDGYADCPPAETHFGYIENRDSSTVSFFRPVMTNQILHTHFKPGDV